MSASLPRTIYGYVWQSSGKHQVALSLLSVAVFGLSTAPLEIQRRIVNDLAERVDFSGVVWLAGMYAAVSLAEQTLKLFLNIYRGWVAERTVRSLRYSALTSDTVPCGSTGVEIAMVLDEAEPIGGFSALSFSEPLLQGGILASVLTYMFYLQPDLALTGLAFFIPQTVLVPWLQHAINRRARRRIVTLREISGEILEGEDLSEAGTIERVFRLNMGIYWLKYLMNLFMNLMHHLSVAVALCLGGWMVFKGSIEVGTVVAVVGGLGKLNDPWGDLVNWAREFSVVGVKYRLFADAVAVINDRSPTPAGLDESEAALPG